jgi:hypothetical protein
MWLNFSANPGRAPVADRAGGVRSSQGARSIALLVARASNGAIDRFWKSD